MKLILTLLAVVIYWSLDAYQTVLNLGIPFSKAIVLDYDNANPLIKIVIAFSIFIFSMIHSKAKIQMINKKQCCSTEKLTAIYAISNITLSPVPLHKQMNSIVEIMEKELKVATAFIASFESDKILLLNTNDSLTKIGIKPQYQPHCNELAEKSLDKLLSLFYLEKRDYIEDSVQINGVIYKIIIQSYKEVHSKKHLGIAAMLLNDSDENSYEFFIKKVCEQVAFTTELINKKNSAIRAQQLYNAQFSSMDSQLNIPNNSKVQEMIEHEIKRSRRYGTQLSIILIEVDHMKNLANIFTEKETLSLKKEIASLFKKSVRETDMFGKWSDDNFVIIAPDIDFRAAKSFANKFTIKLSEHRFPKVGKVTCSYGITSFSSKDTIGDFRKRAENALKAAIERGGNAIEIKILV